MEIEGKCQQQVTFFQEMCLIFIVKRNENIFPVNRTNILGKTFDHIVHVGYSLTGLQRGSTENNWTRTSPEPLAAEARDGEDPPVDEDAKLGLIVPVWQRSGVNGFPVSSVSSVAGADQQQPNTEKHNVQTRHFRSHLAHASRFKNITKLRRLE